MQLSKLNITDELNEYFNFISKYYKRESYCSLTAKYQFRFTHEGSSYDWYFSVDREKISHSKGTLQNPDITIFTSYSLWLKISSGRKNAVLEYLTKGYTIKGPLKFLLLFKKYFGSIAVKSRMKKGRRPDPWESSKKRIWKKPGKVLVINASPRMKKGFTYRYLKPFIQGMSEAIKDVEVISIYSPRITLEPCRGCESCWRNGGKCVINDDGNTLIEKILNSKLTVFAMPLYIDSMPAKLKSLLDRFFVQTKPEFEMDAGGLTRHPIVNQSERYFALFAVCGYPELRHLKTLTDTFRSIGRNFHTPVIANILKPGSQYIYLNPLMASYRTVVEAAAFKAGAELVNTGKVKGTTLRAIRNTGKVSMTKWRYYANMYWAGSEKDEL